MNADWQTGGWVGGDGHASYRCFQERERRTVTEHGRLPNTVGLLYDRLIIPPNQPMVTLSSWESSALPNMKLHLTIIYLYCKSILRLLLHFIKLEGFIKQNIVVGNILFRVSLENIIYVVSKLVLVA